MLPSGIQAISFDCSMTLLEDQWDPARFAMECAEQVGLPVDRDSHGPIYRSLLRRGWPEFRERNLTRDSKLCDSWWDDLTLDWIRESGLDHLQHDQVMSVARARLLDPTDVFRVFADTLPALRGLKAQGIRLAVLSNWDNSLHRVIESHGLSEYFEVVIASLEEGVEKPEPLIFEILLERLGCRADQVLHVGDNPLDDFQGARGAGLHGRIIDRSSPSPEGIYISSLTDLLEK